MQRGSLRVCGEPFLARRPKLTQICRAPRAGDVVESVLDCLSIEKGVFLFPEDNLFRRDALSARLVVVARGVSNGGNKSPRVTKLAQTEQRIVLSHRLNESGCTHSSMRRGGRVVVELPAFLGIVLRAVAARAARAVAAAAASAARAERAGITRARPLIE